VPVTSPLRVETEIRPLHGGEELPCFRFEVFRLEGGADVAFAGEKK
jgi:hypothetical protein